jgi:polyferredoxin
MEKQKLRKITQSLFFILFCIAPILNLFRFDLDQGHFYLLTFNWSVGIGENLPVGALAFNLLLYGLIPVVLVLILGFYFFYKFGRIYCGWLCPHFSVVETINKLMSKAIGKLSIWDENALPKIQVDGRIRDQSKAWWLVVVPFAIFMAFLWAVILMGYVVNPRQVFLDLWNHSLSFPKQVFIIAATSVLSFEFLFARHLFCRFGCAFGIFQSLAWMGNRKGLVISFNKDKASQCKSCDNFCDHACPMRLKPRGLKRHMFSCTQCTQCLTACEIAQNGNPVLSWKPGSDEDKNSVAIPLNFDLLLQNHKSKNLSGK